jgi:hypothetical protein
VLTFDGAIVNPRGFDRLADSLGRIAPGSRTSHSVGAVGLTLHGSAQNYLDPPDCFLATRPYGALCMIGRIDNVEDQAASVRVATHDPDYRVETLIASFEKSAQPAPDSSAISRWRTGTRAHDVCR